MTRNYSIDTLRTIVTIFVILVHVSGEYVLLGMNNKDYDLSFWIGNVVGSFIHVCVPVFVLISGMFLIGRKESFKQFYKKKAVRVLIPLVVWSFVYLVYRALTDYVVHRDFDIYSLIKSVVLGKPFYHMWYLYMLIGLYLVTPLINIAILKISNKNLWKISILLMLFGIINSGYDLIANNQPFFILWFVNYLGYFILGYAIKGRNFKISSKMLFIIYIISGILICLLSYWSAKYYGNIYFYSYLSPFVIIGSLSIYILFQKLDIKENPLSKISQLTFGIYLIHAGILQVFTSFLRKLDIHNFDNPILGIPIKFSVTFVISAIVIYFLQKSRIFNKIV